MHYLTQYKSLIISAFQLIVAIYFLIKFFQSRNKFFLILFIIAMVLAIWEFVSIYPTLKALNAS